MTNDAQWTNTDLIASWDRSADPSVLEATAADGDFAKRHLANPALLRLLGDVHGARVLDAGCGNGYFARILARRGAEVVGVEPAGALYRFACGQEAAEPLGIAYLQAELASLPDIGRFDAVVCSMVLMAIPDWRAAMRACVDLLKPGGRFVFALVHPAFERLLATWSAHGEYRIAEYLAEYVIPGPSAPDFHRPLSTYLNELARLGCRLVELAEPGLDPGVAAAVGADSGPGRGIEGYVQLPNFLIVAADAP